MFKTSAQLRLENLALRQQLTVLRRSAPKRLKLTRADRIFWVWLRRVWGDWKSALMIVQSRDRHRVASRGFSLVLDVANPPWQAGSPQGAARDSRSDPDAEPQQSALGCAAHSWRITKAGYRDHGTYCGEVHGSTSQTAFTDLADVSRESCEDDGVGGLLYRPDDPVRDPVCVSRAGA